MTSDTPLTDAAVVGEMGDDDVQIVTADFARRLERQLNELRAAATEVIHSESSYPRSKMVRGTCTVDGEAIDGLRRVMGK
jgi:hypothetical protein